jgi:hypothetical protein
VPLTIRQLETRLPASTFWSLVEDNFAVAEFVELVRQGNALDFRGTAWTGNHAITTSPNSLNLQAKKTINSAATKQKVGQEWR